jgi:uncharacterized protein (DUF58 family)
MNAVDDGYGALLDALRGVRWPARRPVTTGAPGAHHSRARGVSAEFTEYRPYRQGDDPRRLDWKLLARSDRAYVRLATDRTILGTLILADTSASMDFPREGSGKWTCARRLAVGLAAVAHADGDPVGLVLPLQPKPQVLPPRTRRGVVSEIARTLDAADVGGAPPLTPAFTVAGSVARIAVVTDLLGDAEALLAAAREHVAAGGEVHLVHVVAREELDPPHRALLAADPEDADLRRPLTPESLAEYLSNFAAWREEAARAWRAAGASYTLVATDEPAERAVRRIARPDRP